MLSMPPLPYGRGMGWARLTIQIVYLIKETLIEATPRDNDEWFLINSLSCHPIKILGGGSGLDPVDDKKKLIKDKTNG